MTEKCLWTFPLPTIAALGHVGCVRGQQLVEILLTLSNTGVFVCSATTEMPQAEQFSTLRRALCWLRQLVTWLYILPPNHFLLSTGLGMLPTLAVSKALSTVHDNASQLVCCIVLHTQSHPVGSSTQYWVCIRSNL